MTRKKPAIVAFLLAGLAGVGVGAWFAAPGGPGSPSRFERIQEGRGLEQVEALMAVPPGDYTTEPAYCTGLIRGWPDVGKKLPELVALTHERDPRCRLWCGDGGVIEVNFDEHGLVVAKQFHEVRRERRT